MRIVSGRLILHALATGKAFVKNNISLFTRIIERNRRHQTMAIARTVARYSVVRMRAPETLAAMVPATAGKRRIFMSALRADKAFINNNKVFPHMSKL